MPRNHPRRNRRKDAPDVSHQIPVWLRDRERGKIPSTEQIRKTRQFAALTLDEMAAMLHVGKRTYQDWESGRTPMHPNHWLAMRCACHAYRMRQQAEAEAIRRESYGSE